MIKAPILIPFNSFEWSARSLSNVHILHNMATINVILRTLLSGYGDLELNSVRIWRRYERALLRYQQVTSDIWVSERGGSQEFWDEARYTYLKYVVDPMQAILILPPWMGYVDMHISHQSYLLRVDPDFYKDRFVGISNSHAMIWPI